MIFILYNTYKAGARDTENSQWKIIIGALLTHLPLPDGVIVDFTDEFEMERGIDEDDEKFPVVEDLFIGETNDEDEDILDLLETLLESVRVRNDMVLGFDVTISSSSSDNKRRGVRGWNDRLVRMVDIHAGGIIVDGIDDEGIEDTDILVSLDKVVLLVS